MYKLIEYSNNYSKASGSLWQYCKDIPAVDIDGDIVDFNGANATDSFNFKAKITGQTNDDGNMNQHDMAHGVLKIKQEEQLLIKHSILPKMDTKKDLILRFTNFLIKNPLRL